jgi:phosphohistidine phosphatase
MRLWVIRHAKSDWSHPGQGDFDRPLNERGRRDGPRMAEWLAGQKDPARWIWSSDAVRARETATYVTDGFRRAQPELVLDRRLYLAEPEGLLDVLRETPDDVDSVAVIAHNPGLTDLVNLLAGERVLDNLPTFGVAAFKVKAPWVELRAGAGRLLTLMSPKRLPGNRN